MRWRWLVGLGLVWMTACEDGSAPDAWTPTTGGPAATPPVTTPVGSDAQVSTPVPTAQGDGAVPSARADAGTTSPAPAQGSGLPCAVEAALKTKCQTCHGNPLMSGPMPLTSRADLLAVSSAVPGAKIHERVKARIHDAAKPMPPAARPTLTAAELSALDAYLSAGAPEVRETCAQPGPTTEPGKLGEWQPPDSDCEVMLELRGHGGQTEGDTTPFEAPTGGDHYEMFYYRPTWTQKMHVIRIDPIIDNGAVLHHWLLYMEDGNNTGYGTHKSDLGLQSANAQLLSGWAPGNQSIPLGKEVGMQVIQAPNARFAIELHYNTDANPPNRKDRSGARLCLTSKLRPKEAGTHWLGTQAIVNLLPFGGKYDAVGTCTTKAESHIIAYSPHLHKYGRAAKTLIKRADGSSEVLNEGPFDFTDQRIFPVTTPSGEVVVKPGDVLTTTCTYDATNIFTFGPGTNDEMCYNFVVAWPVGSLSNGNAGIVGGKNSCIDGI
jgi:hypothetical protein